MSKSKSGSILDRSKKYPNGWEKAISDAERKIAALRKSKRYLSACVI
jgi:hypothetical protein